MTEQRDIEDTVNTVRDNKSAVSQKSNPLDRTVSSVSDAWKGDVGVAFKGAGKRAKAEMSAVISAFGAMSGPLKKLLDEVKKAERERNTKK
jgi:uncharacterized protein YukE